MYVCMHAFMQAMYACTYACMHVCKTLDKLTPERANLAPTAHETSCRAQPQDDVCARILGLRHG